jgi:hypothetical protein
MVFKLQNGSDFWGFQDVLEVATGDRVDLAFVVSFKDVAHKAKHSRFGLSRAD